MQNKSIAILSIKFLRGPNMWTYRPVIEALIDIGELEDYPSNTIPGFYERLTSWLPSLVEHRCGIGERGGFLQRLREGTWPGHILEHVTIELQNLAGMQSGFGKARETSQRGVYKVVVRSRNEDVSREALYAARDLVMAAIKDHAYDVQATVARLRDMVDKLCLGPSTACIVDAATARGIPSIRLTEGNLVQLGYGARSRRIWTAETDRTSAIGETISRDKDLTKSLLQTCGVPTPHGRIVKSPQEAWEAAEDIGLPVVVKPTDANHGRGVSLELYEREDIEAAYHIADAEGSDVIVEKFIRGEEHRLLVVGGKLAAAARGESLWVVGDGKANIVELIDTQLNSDPRRGEEEEFPLETIRLEREPAIQLLLQRQGLSGDSIPADGQRILIQRNGNIAIDVTDHVHPEVAATVALAARVIGLDIAGVDLVAEDISRPLSEQQGAIVEINAGPGLLMHLKPASGEPRPVGQAIIDYLFPDEDNGRIPVVGICGGNDTTLARLLGRLLEIAGKRVGIACNAGLWHNQRLVEDGPRATWTAAHKLLLNRMVEIAVLENSAEEILTNGLAYDRCQVGVVTGLQHFPSLEEHFIHTDEQLANVLRTQVDVVLNDGVAVLNADVPAVAAMAQHCDGEVILYGLEASTMAEHLNTGGRAVLIADDHVVLAHGTQRTQLESLSAIPYVNASADDALSATGNLLAAVAAAWALDIPANIVRAGIETFHSEIH